MDKSAKHDAKYGCWIRRSNIFRILKKRSNLKGKVLKKERFKRCCSDYAKTFRVAVVLIKRSYVPDETLTRQQQVKHYLSHHMSEKNLQNVWEQAKKIAL